VADKETVERLRRGVVEWNAWRKANPDAGLDLSDAFLYDADLRGANLYRSILSGANLSGANLERAILSRADLRGATLTKAELVDSVFGNVDLTGARGLDTCIHRGLRGLRAPEAADPPHRCNAGTRISSASVEAVSAVGRTIAGSWVGRSEGGSLRISPMAARWSMRNRWRRTKARAPPSSMTAPRSGSRRTRSSGL
jgi:hypothetical protein